MNSGKVVLGILVGAGIGAALGLLYAPEKGSTTRRHIGNKKDDIADSLKEMLNEYVDSYAKKYEKVSSSAKNVVADGKSKLNELKSEISGSKA
jgi:gas vesicle protein